MEETNINPEPENNIPETDPETDSGANLGLFAGLKFNKKNLRLWILVIILILAAVFASILYLKKLSKVVKPVAKPEISQEEKDKKAYAKAIESYNIDICDQIVNQASKDNCKKMVFNVSLYHQAIKQYNPEICKEIQEAEIKEACIKVAESGVSYLKENDPQALARVYSNSHNAQAIQQYEKLLETEPNNVINLLALALAYAEAGLKEQEQGKNQLPNVEKALAAVEKAKKLEPNNPEVYRAEGYVYEVKPDLGKSLASYSKAIELDPKNILAYVGRGHANNLLGAVEKALEDFNKAAELDVKKENIFVYANLCRLESSKSDTLDKAIEHCQTAAAIKTDDTVFKSEVYQMLANVYKQKKNYSNAKNYLLKAKALAPNDPNVYVALANLGIATEKYSEAQMDAQKAIAISSTKAVAYQALSYALYKQEKYSEAIDAANKGLDLVDKDVSLLAPKKKAFKKDLYYTLANIYNRMGDQTNEMKYKELGDKALSN